MTNNPDSKAPERIWAYGFLPTTDGVNCNARSAKPDWTKPDKPPVEYTRTDAITPQQAAKVLLENCPNPIFDVLKGALMGEHSFGVPEIDEDGDEVRRDIVVPWTTQKEIIQDALKALAESKE